MNMAALMRGICPFYFLLLTGLAAAQPPTTGTGIRGQYYDGRNFEKLVLTRTDPTINFDWTIGPDGNHFIAPGPGLSGEYFSVRWTGFVYAPVTGVYTFRMTTDDGMRVWIGGRNILDSWLDQKVMRYTTRKMLTAGRYYSLRVEYYQARWATRALLAWRLPDALDDPNPIPKAYLYPALPATAKPLTAIQLPPRNTVVGVVPAKVAAVLPAFSKRKPNLITKRTLPVASRRVRLTYNASQPRPRLPATVELPKAAFSGLSATDKGVAVTLPNLYFTQGTASLLPTSRLTLNSLAQILHQQPAMHLEIAGHTDNVGEPALNLRLSEQRAQVVRRYLVQQGIDSARLVARGYGGTHPVADNRDPQQRARNRRVEVTVQ